MSKLIPSYTLWEAIDTALALGGRALQEIRTLARTPGPRGEDGLGFDDLTVEFDGQRKFTFKLERGDATKEFSFTVPCMIYCGVWSDQRAGGFQRGDVVTWDGCCWVALKDTTARPANGSGSADWQLAVKKGRDGRDALPPQPDLPAKPIKMR